MKPTILVTGATGNTGGAVVRRLRELDWPVRAIIRHQDKRAAALQRLGAETVEADVFDPQQLREAMQGVTRAYYLPFFHPYMLQSANAFAVAARDAELEYIVQMSQWLSNPAHPSLATRQTWLVDQTFGMIPGVAHTIINPGFFADNFLRIIDYPAALGIYPVLTGDSKSAPVSNEDIARVVVACLTEGPDKHAGKIYRPTGPKLLTGAEIAAIIGQVLQKKVRPFPMPFWMLLKVARLQRISPFLMSGYRQYIQEHLRGTFELNGGVTTVVEDLSGSPAEPFEATVRRYAALPKGQQTLANRLRVLLEFCRTPFSPGYNLNRYERELAMPLPSKPLFSYQSELWRKEHILSERRQAPTCESIRVTNSMTGLKAG